MLGQAVGGRAYPPGLCAVKGCTPPRPLGLLAQRTARGVLQSGGSWQPTMISSRTYKVPCLRRTAGMFILGRITACSAVKPATVLRGHDCSGEGVHTTVLRLYLVDIIVRYTVYILLGILWLHGTVCEACQPHICV